MPPFARRIQTRSRAGRRRHDVWAVDTIRERQNWMAKQATGIWHDSEGTSSRHAGAADARLGNVK